MSDNGLVLDHIAPHSVKRIHLVGVAGTGMGSFAGMLKAAGYDVTGSDANVYPPMSDMLRAWGIDVMTPYAAENLDRARPDLVIIGNVIRRENPSIGLRFPMIGEECRTVRPLRRESVNVSRSCGNVHRGPGSRDGASVPVDG